MDERQLGYELRLAEQAWRKNLERPLRDFGLTVPQYSTLRALEQSPGASSAELARSAFVTPQTMNAMVLSLEADGLIERTARTTNLRARDTQLTTAGKATMGKARRLVRRLEAAAVAELTDFEHAQLIGLLGRFTAALDPAATSPGHG